MGDPNWPLRSSFPTVRVSRRAPQYDGPLQPLDYSEAVMLNHFQESHNRLLDGGGRPSSEKSRGSFFRWLPEILWLVITIACIIVIVVVLRLYDSKPPPQWPFGVTMNSVLALLVSLCRLAFMAPVVEGLSQLKWIWFSSRARPLTDFQLYDEASRGPWGGIKLIAQLKGYLACLAALLTLSSVFTSTITQQVLQFQSRLERSVNQTARVPRGTDFNLYDGHGLALASGAQLREKQAILNGAFMVPGESISDTSPNCPSGDCTWENYGSLAICSEVVNLTASAPDDVLAAVRNMTVTKIAQTVNETLVINGPSDAGNQTFPPLYPVLIQSLMSPTQLFNDSVTLAMASNQVIAYSDSMTRPSVDTDMRPFKFLEIAFFWCTKSYSTKVQSGLHTTDEITSLVDVIEPSPWGFNWYWSPAFQQCYADSTCDTLVGGKSAKLRGPSNATGPESYGVGIFTALPASAYLAFTLQDMLFLDSHRGVASAMNTAGSGASSAFGTALYGNMLDTSSPNPSEQMDHVQSIARNVAKSVTNLIRVYFGGTNGTVLGTVFEPQTIIKVQWKWMALLIAQLTLTCVFLVATVIITRLRRVHIVKDNALSTLCGLSEETRETLRYAGDIDGLTRRAKGLYVMLGKGDSGDGMCLKAR